MLLSTSPYIIIKGKNLFYILFSVPPWKFVFCSLVSHYSVLFLSLFHVKTWRRRAWIDMSCEPLITGFGRFFEIIIIIIQGNFLIWLIFNPFTMKVLKTVQNYWNIMVPTILNSSVLKSFKIVCAMILIQEASWYLW